MNKKRLLYTVPLALVLLLGACGKNDSSSVESSKSEASQSAAISSSSQSSKLESSSSVESKPSSEVSSTMQPVSTNPPSTNTTPTTNTNTNNTNNTGNTGNTNNTSHSTNNTSNSTQSDSNSSANPGSGTGSSGGESSSELPTNAAYYALYDEQEIALVENNTNLLENQIAEYRGELGNVEKNKTIAILDDQKNPIVQGIGPEEHDNNVVTSEGNYVIHNDATNASVIFKKWQDGGMSLYVSGYESDPVIEPVYKVVGLNDDWDYANGIGFTDATEGSGYTKQLKASFDVNPGDEFRVKDQNENWVNKDLFESNDYFGTSDDNILAHANGSVDLYFKTYTEGYQSIAIVFTPEWHVVGLGDGWNYNESAIVLTDDPNPDYASQLKATFSVDVNDEFKVFDGYTGWLGQNCFEANASFTTVEGGNIKSNVKGNITLYLRTLNDENQTMEIVILGDKVTVNLTVTKEGVADTDAIYLVGPFCEWSPSSNNAIKFVKGEGNVWTAQIEINLYTSLEYKLVTANKDNPTDIVWEAGDSNYKIDISEAGTKELVWHN